MNKKYAIFFSISNSYAFALCNALMSLAKNSLRCVENCDIIVYSNDLTENNKNVIKKINSNCKFYKIQTSEDNEDFIKNHTLPKFFLEYPAVKTRWGIWNLFKLAAYTFLEEYEKILILDADIFLNKEIYTIFDAESPFAWRELQRRNNIKDIEELKKINIYDGYSSSFCTGGVVLLNKNIKNYCSITKAFNKFKEVSKDSDIHLIDEMFHTWISRIYKIPVKILNREWNDINNNDITNIKIIHFFGKNNQPWNNINIIKMVPEWFENHKKILSIGIDGI